MRHEAVFVKHAFNVPVGKLKWGKKHTAVSLADTDLMRRHNNYSVVVPKQRVAPVAAIV
jgi:hypothetical protein